MKVVDVYIVVNEGQLINGYDNPIDADCEAEEISQDNINYVTKEYDLDEDSENYMSDASVMAGYEGGNPYSCAVCVDLDDLDREYLTSENDCFTGAEILEVYSANGFDPEQRCHTVDEDESEGSDEFGEGDVMLEG